jgi:diguanylate cyclase (GGDEF)-like protein/PAS domain S-box-containing protein
MEQSKDKGAYSGSKYSELTATQTVTGTIVLLVGMAAMVGWWADIDFLKRVAPGLATMKFNTALCFALLGGALATGARGWVSNIAQLVVAGIATASLFEYVVGMNLGIDELIFKDPDGLTLYPGRMAASTAACLLSAAISIRFMHRSPTSMSGVLPSLMLMIGWLTSLGYLFGVEALYNVGPFSTMAAHTATCVVLLGVGLLAAQPDGVLPWIARGADPGAALMRRLTPVVVLGIPSLAYLRLWAERADWYGTEFGLSVMVILSSGTILAVGVRSAIVVNREWRARNLSMGQLKELTRTLEDRVADRTRELATSEALFRATFDSSPFGIALIDGDRRVKRVNPALSALLGYLPSKVVGQSLEVFLLDDIGRSLLADPAPESPCSAEIQVLRGDGTTRWASIRCSEIEEGEESLKVVQFVDTTLRHEMEERLTHMADHDPLTGLLNRRSFGIALDAHVAQCQRYGPEGSLLMLDLDRFKQINDTLGHDVGDQVIVAASRILQRRLRDSDVLGRLGGDEFVILLPRGGETEARAVASSLVKMIGSHGGRVQDPALALSTSIGIAYFDGGDRSSQDMMVSADVAMYEAKQKGRGRWAEAPRKSASASTY